MTIRMSEKEFAQFKLFSGEKVKNPAKGEPKQRVKKKKADLPENQLEAQIQGFLASRGWTVERNHVGTYIPVGTVMQLEAKGIHSYTKEILFRGGLVRIHEKGYPDFTAHRPLKVPDKYGVRQVFDYETKAPSGKLRPEQRALMEKRVTMGLAVAWFDDFDGDWDTSFIPWYRAHFPGDG